MFTGIIRATAKVKRVEGQRGNHRMMVATPRGWKLAEGGSVAVNGICSTVIGKKKGTFVVEYMPETLRVTMASSFAPGQVVNLEQPLRLGETLDGHFVQGHVDGVATVARIALKGNSREVSFRIPKELKKFVVRKGSIAVNGVALTVARVQRNEYVVALMPYTLVHTNLGALKKGDSVNIEIDLIARYLASLQGK